MCVCVCVCRLVTLLCFHTTACAVWCEISVIRVTQVHGGDNNKCDQSPSPFAPFFSLTRPLSHNQPPSLALSIRELLFSINVCKTGRFMSGVGSGLSAILEDEDTEHSSTEVGVKKCGSEGCHIYISSPETQRA